MSDLSQQLAVKALVTDALRSTYKALDFDEDENNAPVYARVSVTRRFGGVDRVSGSRRGSGWRIFVRVVAPGVQECMVALGDVAQIENQRLTVDGEQSSPIRFESATAPELDDGLYSGASTWTYAF